jgi:hypothetical protein
MTKERYTEEEVKGKKFGHLILKEKIKELINYGNYKISWICECVCGKIVKRRQSDLFSNNTFSCGCMHKHKHLQPNQFSQWKGCGELDGSHFAEIKNRAKTHNHEFNITIEYLWELFLAQNRQCKLTNLPLTLLTQRRKRKPGAEQTGSLDRIDSNKGYIEGNVQWIHKDVNRMKNYYSQDYFIEICRLVTKIQESQSRTLIAQPHETAAVWKEHLAASLL